MYIIAAAVAAEEEEGMHQVCFLLLLDDDHSFKTCECVISIAPMCDMIRRYEHFLPFFFILPLLCGD